MSAVRRADPQQMPAACGRNQSHAISSLESRRLLAKVLQVDIFWAGTELPEGHRAWGHPIQSINPIDFLDNQMLKFVRCRIRQRLRKISISGWNRISFARDDGVENVVFAFQFGDHCLNCGAEARDCKV